jgi:O-antigen ligase
MAAACGFIYRLGWKNGLDRAILCVIALMLAVVTATVLTLGTDTIMRILRDPDAFTGRTEIWAADFAYVRDHFFLGSGFEAIFGTGKQSPLAAYLPMQSWVIDVNDSHNGYIDILVGLGALGFGVALVALVVIPLARFWPLNFDPARDGYFALFLFILCHNFTEADFLAPDGTLWLAFLMVIGALRQGRGYAVRQGVPPRAPALTPLFSALAASRARA